PLKVAALGETGGSVGFADELRPPAGIGGDQPRWPVSQPQRAAPGSSYPASSYPASSYPDSAARQSAHGGGSNGPISLTAPGIAADEGEIELPPNGAPSQMPPRYGSSVGRVEAYPQDDRSSASRSERYPAPRDDRGYAPQNEPYSAAPAPEREPAAGSQDRSPLPRLGPPQGNAVNSFGAVAVTPTATLACPIVSALDRWLTDSVQPSAMRWFGSRVVEIKQISAYSCRGMNGNSRAHISEHAFGNALDIAAFTLADGRRITVKDGWKGMAEEQGFLRDIQGAACQQFNTVLAPGSNVYHYDHIHVDLMRRASRRVICQPGAVSGEEVASRATQRNRYATREPYVTGSLGGRHTAHRGREKIDEEDEFMDE
ncbi:MAG TPA: extensin family protein, partial [Bradyrhizobium sp.]|nr:extensin family protein [Bradyrhizobium sp.]